MNGNCSSATLWWNWETDTHKTIHKPLLKWGAEILTRGLTLLSSGALVPLIWAQQPPWCQLCIEKGHSLWPEGEWSPGTLAKEGGCSQSSADFTRVPHFNLSRVRTFSAFWARGLHWLHPNSNLTLIQRSFMLYQMFLRLYENWLKLVKSQTRHLHLD